MSCRAAALLCCGALLLFFLRQSTDAAVSPPNWPVDRGDPHRSGWQEHETALTPATASGMSLIWKVHLNLQPHQMHALLPPLVAGAVTTAQGLTQVVVVAGASDVLYGVNADTGQLLWKHQFIVGARGGLEVENVLCPGGQTATPVVTGSSAPGSYTAYALPSDGTLRTVDVETGVETDPPAPYVPAGSKAYALNLWQGVIYTTTAQHCGGRPNALYAYDLRHRSAASFSAGDVGLWGRAGASIGRDGTVFTGAGDGPFDPRRGRFGQSIIAVRRDPVSQHLVLSDYFAPRNAEWLRVRDLDLNVTGPVFSHEGREYVAESGKECRVWVLETRSLGGADHRSPAAATPLICNEAARSDAAGIWGALATWRDESGVRWILAPVWGPTHSAFHAPIEHGPVEHGAVIAFRFDTGSAPPRLLPAWISRDMNMAEPPVVAGGVVFGYGSGESTRQYWPDPRHVGGTAGRIAESTHAVLYALDGQTGEELWSSGDQITSWNHFSGIAVANGRVYIGTYDGTLYCFGIHRS